MKQKIHIKLAYLLSLLTTSLVCAQTFSDSNNLTYIVTTGTNVSVSGNITIISGSLIIPSTVTNANIQYTVTSITDYAFDACPALTSVTIPNSITSIGRDAFYGCSGLTSVTIPNSVTSISDHAFGGCSGLTSVSISNFITSIEIGTFRGCSGLNFITIPNSANNIGNSAFENCTGLTTISIPNSVTSIGFDAFNNCSGLTTLTIPNSVTSIGSVAFGNCTGLTNVNVSWATPLVIDNTVFYGVTIGNIPLNVSFPDLVSDYKAAAIWQNFKFGALSTDSFKQDTKLRTYPNPTTNYINISGLTRTENYSLFSDLGAKISIGSVSNNEKIDIQNLINGIYFIKLEDGNSFKFIKN